MSTQEETLPPPQTVSPTIVLRVLLSLKEAAKIIGLKGSTISKIRETHGVKIGISEKVSGCSDRILSCAGPIINVANALSDCVDILNEKDYDAEGNLLPPLKFEKYNFHFLNHLLPPPSRNEVLEEENGEEENDDGETKKQDANEANLEDQVPVDKIGNLRLIVPNRHLSSIIGKGGVRIKALIETYGVKIVASKHFLPDSSERVLEIQGFPASISKVLIEISEILLNDVDINFIPEKHYYPHLKHQSNGFNTRQESDTSYHPSNNNFENNSNNNDEFKVEVLIPEIYVGALIGKQGNRIANLKDFTKTKIIIERKDDESRDDSSNRIFTIIGHLPKNVKLAESMLLKNLDSEIERRQAKFNSDTIVSSGQPIKHEDIE